jgi:hypothetical protein
LHLTAPSEDRVGGWRCASREENAAENEQTADAQTLAASHAAIIRQSTLSCSLDVVLEYACHEGNRAMENTLRAARAEERAAHDTSK